MPAADAYRRDERKATETNRQHEVVVSAVREHVPERPESEPERR